MDIPGAPATGEKVRPLMIRLRWLFLVTFTILAVVTAKPTGAIFPSGINLLLVGSLDLKRSDWPQFQTVRAVTELVSGDTLQATQGNATIFCSGWPFSLKDVTRGTSRTLDDLCPPSENAVIRRPAGNIPPPRGGTDPLLPYIISPRKTKILDDTPLLRWNGVPNATQYTVHLRDDTGVIWTTTVRGNGVIYPGTPRLVQGVSYALVVQADIGASSLDEGISGLAFSLLGSEQTQEVKQSIAELNQQKVPDDGKAVAQAYLYRSYGLTSDAIATLESQVAKGSQDPLVHRLLGDLYHEIRLNLAAKESYIKAVKLATEIGNVEEQAESAAALGEVYLILRDRDEAVRSLQQAKASYTMLEGENSETAQAITEQLSEISQ